MPALSKPEPDGSANRRAVGGHIRVSVPEWGAGETAGGRARAGGGGRAASRAVEAAALARQFGVGGVRGAIDRGSCFAVAGPEGHRGPERCRCESRRGGEGPTPG